MELITQAIPTFPDGHTAALLNYALYSLDTLLVKMSLSPPTCHYEYISSSPVECTADHGSQGAKDYVVNSIVIQVSINHPNQQVHSLISTSPAIKSPTPSIALVTDTRTSF